MQNYKKTRNPQNKLTFFCFAEARQPSRKIPRKKGTPNTPLYLCLRNNKAKNYPPQEIKRRETKEKNILTQAKLLLFPCKTIYSHVERINSHTERIYFHNVRNYSLSVRIKLIPQLNDFNWRLRILFVKRLDKVKPYLLNNHFLPVLHVYPLLAWLTMLLSAVKSVPSIISILVSYAFCRCSRQRVNDRFWFPYLE